MTGGGAPYRFDELHMAYDIYFPDGNESNGDPIWTFLSQQKLPKMATGTALEASHGLYEYAALEGYYGLNIGVKMAGYEWALNGSRTGAIAWDRYDMSAIQKWDWANALDPAVDAKNDGNFWRWPRGEWVSLEIRVKLNTAGTKISDESTSDDTSGWASQAQSLGLPDGARHKDGIQSTTLADGEYELWIKRESDPVAQRIMIRTGLRFRNWDYAKITAGMVYFYNNNVSGELYNFLPDYDQNYYCDNFRWSRNQILPR